MSPGRKTLTAFPFVSARMLKLNFNLLVTILPRADGPVVFGGVFERAA